MTRAKIIRWAPAMDAELIARARAGELTRNAAKAMGCTPGQAVSRLRVLRGKGLTDAQWKGTAFNWTAEADQVVIDAIERGDNAVEVASALGLSKQAVYRRSDFLRQEGKTPGFGQYRSVRKRSADPDHAPKYSKRWIASQSEDEDEADEDGPQAAEWAAVTKACKRHLSDLTRAWEEGAENWPAQIDPELDERDRGRPARRISFTGSSDMAGPGTYW